MKKSILILAAICFTIKGFTQSKNFIDQPYLETSAKVDTLVVPDKISLSIYIAEQDTKGKVSVEEQENNMAKALKGLGIDIDNQLSLTDLTSNFKKYFLKQKDVHKSKEYTLIVYDALSAGKVMQTLEQLKISNVRIAKLEYSKIEELQLELKSKAILKAKQNAQYLVQPLNQKITRAIHITDQFNHYPYVQLDESAIMIRGKSSISNYEPINIQFEKIKVESSVSVKFKLDD